MRFILVIVLTVIYLCGQSQSLPAISQPDVSRIENILAADDMQGRRVFTSGIEKAADFIDKEFKEAGLKPFPGSSGGFRQSFNMIKPVSSEITGTIDGNPLDNKNVIVFSTATSIHVTPADHYQKIYVKKESNFRSVLFKYLDSSINVLVFVDTSFAKYFARRAGNSIPLFERNGNRIFILTSTDPQQYDIQIKQEIKKETLTNLIGIIPGKSKPNEYVIFSAHYDHLGIGKPDMKGDSIYNGANDDASGTTAVITLAKYFSKLRNNERTLVFVTFTAEEIGEFGSAYFSRNMDAEKVVAMFNIEMIGTESKWGKNSAYITGYDKTNMGSILQSNLVNSQFKFYPDPYPEQGLFLRSDNATLARKGVPAHTISTSKMDSEKYYHTQGDGVETLDMNNMTEIIQAISLSAGSIISGKDTPGRVVMDN
ncbi:MAG TPA: M28 family peptidase [Puia sp.]|nr:M28 family peptidase [Puia sp.]